MKKTLVALALFSLIACSKSADTGGSTPTPNPASTTATLEVSPVWNVGPPTSDASVLTYGDSATVKAFVTTVSSAGATASETITLSAIRPLKDTTLQYSVTRNGVTATVSRLVKVAAPMGNVLLMVNRPWFERRVYIQNPDGSWKDLGALKTCILTNPQTFYLDLTSRIPMSCETTPIPDGIFKWGFRKNGTKLYWGGVISPTTGAEKLYDIKTLTDNLMQLVQEIPGVNPDGSIGTSIAMIEYVR